MALVGVSTARDRGARREADQRATARKLRALTQRNGQLSAQLAYLKRSGQVDSDACNLVQQSLGSLQKQNSDLREQLAFYRGIVSPQQSATGLRVYDFKLAPHAGQPRSYDFELLLVQSLHHNRSTRGEARLRIDGLQGKVARHLDIGTRDGGKADDLTFSFKYFQELDGRFQLPSGFRPLRVTVNLVSAGAQPVVSQGYDWSKVIQTAQKE